MNTDPVSKQAFSQARQRLRHTVFQETHADGLRVIYSLTPKEGHSLKSLTRWIPQFVCL